MKIKYLVLIPLLFLMACSDMNIASEKCYILDKIHLATLDKEYIEYTYDEEKHYVVPTIVKIHKDEKYYLHVSGLTKDSIQTNYRVKVSKELFDSVEEKDSIETKLLHR